MLYILLIFLKKLTYSILMHQYCCAMKIYVSHKEWIDNLSTYLKCQTSKNFEEVIREYAKLSWNVHIKSRQTKLYTLNQMRFTSKDQDTGQHKLCKSNERIVECKSRLIISRLAIVTVQQIQRILILRLNTQQIVSSAILPQNMVDWIRSKISPPAPYRSIRKIFAKKSLWSTNRNCSRDVGNCINKKGKELPRRESHGRLNTDTPSKE